jgi:hypothetical protein
MQQQSIVDKGMSNNADATTQEHSDPILGAAYAVADVVTHSVRSTQHGVVGRSSVHCSEMLSQLVHIFAKHATLPLNLRPRRCSRIIDQAVSRNTQMQRCSGNDTDATTQEHSDPVLGAAYAVADVVTHSMRSTQNGIMGRNSVQALRFRLTSCMFLQAMSPYINRTYPPAELCASTAACAPGDFSRLPSGIQHYQTATIIALPNSTTRHIDPQAFARQTVPTCCMRAWHLSQLSQPHPAISDYNTK